nr:Eco29kI family restriction endonuclease [Deinococcus budaensis]
MTFFQKQEAFPLAAVKSRPKKGTDEARYKAELSKHYGVYVLYYTGESALYRAISERNREELIKPIYVGKAVSPGSRTGGQQDTPAQEEGEIGKEEVSLAAAQAALDADAPASPSNNLFKRLNEHAGNIRKASTTLQVEDFQVRVIPMADALVQWAEATMIKRLKPIWNAEISGFGNHNPGKGRYEQARSIWDQLHPGRAWAERMANLATYDEARLREVIGRSLTVDLRPPEGK